MATVYKVNVVIADDGKMRHVFSLKKINNSRGSEFLILFPKTFNKGRFVSEDLLEDWRDFDDAHLSYHADGNIAYSLYKNAEKKKIKISKGKLIKRDDINNIAPLERILEITPIDIKRLPIFEKEFNPNKDINLRDGKYFGKNYLNDRKMVITLWMGKGSDFVYEKEQSILFHDLRVEEKAPEIFSLQDEDDLQVFFSIKPLLDKASQNWNRITIFSKNEANKMYKQKSI